MVQLLICTMSMTRPSDASPRRMRDGEQEISKSMYCRTGQSSAKKFQGENAQAVPKLLVKLRPFKSIQKELSLRFPDYESVHVVT